MTPTDLPALRRLRQAGTPGEWEEVRHNPNLSQGIPHYSEVVSPDYEIATYFNTPDAALVVAAVNHLPALCDEIETLRARAEESETALRRILAAFNGWDGWNTTLNTIENIANNALGKA